MNLTDLAFFPNAPVKTLDGIGIITGIPDFNAKSNIVRVKFSKVGPKPNALACGKLREFWDSVDYGFYVLNNQNQIILKDILHMTVADGKSLGYDMELFTLDFLKRTLLEKQFFTGFNSNDFKILCHLHFDVFRWIDRKLALSTVEFNTIKNFSN